MAINTPFATGQALASSSATEKMKPGTLVTTGEGKAYRYVKAGAANLVAGNLLQGPPPQANNVNISPTGAHAAGSTTLEVTLGTTEPITANQFRGGQVVISTTPGGGYAYTISSHAAAAGGANVTLYLSDSLNAAVNSTSKVDLVPCPYVGVIQNPTSKTGPVVGVATYPILASQYGWIQTQGPAGVLCQGTPASGTFVVPSQTTAGAIAAANASTVLTDTPVGIISETGVDGKWKQVILNIE